MLKGDMSTALYFVVVAHGDIMQGAEEEGLLASNGFLVATAILERVEQEVDALNLIPLYVKQHVKTQGLMLLLIACLH
jgi:hypothetical protein